MSMIALQSYDLETASSILADAALSLGPRPSDEQSPWQPQIDAVLHELRANLGLSEAQDSPAARLRLDDALAAAMDEVGFSEQDISAATRHLGNIGALSAGSYKISINNDFPKRFKENPDFIKKCVLNAEFTQHLSVDLPDLALEKQSRLSIFMKRVGAGKSEHWMIVNAHRVGDDLLLIAAWRAFPEVLDLTKAEEPLDVLRLFAQHYGYDVEIVGIAKGKFLEQLGLGISGGATHQTKFDVPKGRTFFLQEGYYRDVAGNLILAYSYAIDEGKYRADKVRHGT